MLSPAFETSLAWRIPAVCMDNPVRGSKQFFILIFSKIMYHRFHHSDFLSILHGWYRVVPCRIIHKSVQNSIFIRPGCTQMRPRCIPAVIPHPSAKLRSGLNQRRTVKKRSSEGVWKNILKHSGACFLWEYKSSFFWDKWQGVQFLSHMEA